MSDILIRGMEMPKGGYRTVEIGFDADGHPMAICDGGDVYDVIPVPPHGDLIDRDKLLNGDGVYLVSFQKSAIDTRKIIKAPIVIPAEEGE